MSVVNAGNIHNIWVCILYNYTLVMSECLLYNSVSWGVVSILPGGVGRMFSVSCFVV